MALAFDERFEGDLSAYALTGSPSLTTTSPLEGSQSLEIAATGQEYINRSADAGNRVGAYRVYGRVVSLPSGGNAVIHRVVANAKNFDVQMTTAGKFRLVITGGTAQTLNSPACAAGDEFVLDVLVDSSSSTYTIDAQVSINGGAATAITQATLASAAADFTNERLGNGNAQTCDFIYDAWAGEYSAAAYPIGPITASPQTINAAHITNAATLHGPTVEATGAVIIDVDSIASAVAIHAATVAAAGVATISHSQLASGASIHGPTIATGALVVTVAQLGTTAALYAPALAAAGHATLAVPRIAATSHPNKPAFAPTGHATISAPALTNTSVLRGGTLAATGAAQIDAGSIPSGETLHGPAVTPGVVTLYVPRIAAVTTPKRPSVRGSGTVTITAPSIDTTAAVEAPTISGAGSVVIAAPSIDSPITPTAPTSVLITGGLEVDEEFDGGFADWLVTGSPVVDAATPIQSGASAHFEGTGFQWLKHVPAPGFAVEVVSFLYRHDAHPTGASATIYVGDTSAGKSAQLRVGTAGVLQCLVSGGGVAVNGPTLVVGQTYLIDLRFDPASPTFVIDWQVDGVDQTQAAYDNGAAAGNTATRVGNVNGTPTFDFTIDAFRLSRVYDNYPLGQPPAAALQLLPGRIEGTEAVHGPAPLSNADTLTIAVSRIAATTHPIKPSIAQVTPPAPVGGYDGPYGFMLRPGNKADLTNDFNLRPWARIARCWIKWSALELSHGSFTWGGVITSLKYCIDHGKMMNLTVQMGRETPAWAYLANPSGALEKIRIYTGPSDTTGYPAALPWDANLRTHYERIVTEIASLLETTYNGKKYGDVIASITWGYSVTGEVGHEMTIGDNGDARNTAMYNAYGTQTERRQWVTEAWIDALDIFFAHLPDYRPMIACGPMWGDQRQGSKDIALYAATTYPDKAKQVMMGPSDMRVNAPGANSYDAWSHTAHLALLYYASIGVTPWCQSAGDGNWWAANVFDIPTADAIKKAWKDNGCDIYRSVLVEGQIDVMNHYGLDSWCRDVLDPAVQALSLPQTISVGRITNTPTIRKPSASIPAAGHLAAARIPSTAQLRGGILSNLDLASPDFVVPCYNKGVIVSSDETPIVSDVGTFVYEVEL